MTKNDIKKALYKEKPWAGITVNTNLDYSYCYSSKCSLGIIYFEVPVADMGDHKFSYSEPAQLLIRWITGFKNINTNEFINFVK